MAEENGPVQVTQPVTQTGATFAERAAARAASEKKAQQSSKQVDEAADTVEDKAVKPAETKRTARKKS